MKIERQDNDELRKLGELIADIETAMMTTLAADGSLVSRPLQTLKLDARGELLFFTSASSAKVAQLTQDSEANLAYADHDDKRFVSIRGCARMDRDPETIDELWSPIQKVFFPEGKDDPQLMVLRIKVRDAVFWEAASGSWLERAMDFAQALQSEEPGVLGTRGRLDLS